MDEWDTDAAGKGLVDSGFILELWVLRFDALELDGDLFAGDDICAFIDVSAYFTEEDPK